MFHPRDTIRSVYDWAKSCLAENITNAFEIYMSPPKVVYDCVSEMTLLEAGMVPAVSLFLSWTEPIVAAAIGCYLRSDMQPNPTSDMEVAEEKGILQTPSVSFVRSNISFPQGTSLVPKPVGAVSSSARYSEDEADNKKPELGNTEKKPKWFKL